MNDNIYVQVNEETLDKIDEMGGTYAGEITEEMAREMFERFVNAKPAMDELGLGERNDIMIQDFALELGEPLPDGMSAEPVSELVEQDGLVMLITEEEEMHVFSIADSAVDIDPSEAVAPNVSDQQAAVPKGFER